MPLLESDAYFEVVGECSGRGGDGEGRRSGLVALVPIVKQVREAKTLCHCACQLGRRKRLTQVLLSEQMEAAESGTEQSRDNSNRSSSIHFPTVIFSASVDDAITVVLHNAETVSQAKKKKKNKELNADSVLIGIGRCQLFEVIENGDGSLL